MRCFQRNLCSDHARVFLLPFFFPPTQKWRDLRIIQLSLHLTRRRRLQNLPSTPLVPLLPFLPFPAVDSPDTVKTIHSAIRWNKLEEVGNLVNSKVGV